MTPPSRCICQASGSPCGEGVPSCIRVRMKASKTDPFCKGQRSILVWEFILSMQCETWWHILWSRPTFLPQDGCSLPCTPLMDWLRQILSPAGMQGNFSSHSFRIGAATVTTHSRVPNHIIRPWGGGPAMPIIWIFTCLPKLWLLCHRSLLKWGLGIWSQLLLVLVRQSTNCRFTSHGWRRIL